MNNNDSDGGKDVARPGSLALAAAAICFTIYFANVVAGAFGLGVFMSDLFEMLTLLAATVFFVVAILAREAATQSSDT
jgi:hypothetical protein